MQAVTPKPVAVTIRPAPKAPAALKITGNPDLWQTLQKVTDPATGWTKTTRAMQVPGGVLINTCSRKTGAPIAAEALVMVPGCHLMRDNTKGWLIA
jgi:hypothetical protein